MRGQNILRKFLFVVFFGIGTAALSGSILCSELLGYYRNKNLLKSAEESLKQLESLNRDYDMLLEQLKADPNALERIAPATLGTEPTDRKAVYPKARAEELAAAREALTGDSKGKVAEPVVPKWVGRCSEPRRRVALFLSGAFLILISFICFGSGEQPGQKAG
jgi:hypothetical protein